MNLSSISLALSRNRAQNLSQQAQNILQQYRNTGAIIVNQSVQEQWEYQQRMLSEFPGDISKLVLFQDSALTTPVTAVGQLVGARLDLETTGSWNGTDVVTAIPGCHMIQPTATKLPTLVDVSGAVALDYDGVNDFMLSAVSLDLSTTDAVSLIIASEKDTDTTGMLVEHGPAAVTQAFFTYARSGGYDWYSRGSTTASVVVSAGYPAPSKDILSATAKIGSDRCQLYVDGVLKGSSVADQGTGNYTSRVLYEGARSGTSLFFNGRSQGFLLVGADLTSTQLQVLGRHVNQKWGAF